jgi:hypothetical protein
MNFGQLLGCRGMATCAMVGTVLQTQNRHMYGGRYGSSTETLSGDSRWPTHRRVQVRAQPSARDARTRFHCENALRRSFAARDPARDGALGFEAEKASHARLPTYGITCVNDGLRHG